MSVPIHLVRGSDPVLVSDEVTALVGRLLDGRDRTEAVDELSGDDYEMGDVVMAASSASMFGDRIIVARHASRFAVDALAPLIAYLSDPNPTSTVVLVWEKPIAANSHPLPKKLSDAVKACGGEVHSTEPPVQAKQRSAWLDARLGEATVQFTSAAKARIAEQLGEDVGRVGALVTMVDSVFGAGTRVGPEDLAPFLGDAGSVPPWELTDAIERGDVAGSIERVQRMIRGDRHPLQVMATLQTHFERMLRLDGSGIRSESEAAAALGMKGSTFPAKKALAASQRLGSRRIARAITLLADADVDLRGRSAWPGELVMEVLVGRLAGLAKR